MTADMNIMMRLFHRVRWEDKVILDDLKFDKNEMRKAFVMQEILKRKVI